MTFEHYRPKKFTNLPEYMEHFIQLWEGRVKVYEGHEAGFQNLANTRRKWEITDWDKRFSEVTKSLQEARQKVTEFQQIKAEAESGNITRALGVLQTEIQGLTELLSELRAARSSIAQGMGAVEELTKAGSEFLPWAQNHLDADQKNPVLTNQSLLQKEQDLLLLQELEQQYLPPLS